MAERASDGCDEAAPAKAAFRQPPAGPALVEFGVAASPVAAPAGVQVVERAVVSSEAVECSGPVLPCSPCPAAQAGTLPEAYQHGALVNVTPVDVQAQRIGIGLAVGEQRLRVALGVGDARALVRDLMAYLAAATTSHEANSSGRPRLDVLPQEG